MSGNDRRTALLGRLEKIRELIASFFRAFTQDEVHHACLRQQPYSTVQPPSITSGRPAQGNRISIFGRLGQVCNFERDRFYRVDDNSRRRWFWIAFIECWKGLARTGNAVRDFHEILAIAMCAVLCGEQGSVDIGRLAKSKEPFLGGFLRAQNGVPSHDTFTGFSACSIGQLAAFQRFMAGFSEQSRQWRSTARLCAAGSNRAAASGRCTWSPPGAASNASCWPRSPPTRSQTKSQTAGPGQSGGFCEVAGHGDAMRWAVSATS